MHATSCDWKNSLVRLCLLCNELAMHEQMINIQEKLMENRVPVILKCKCLIYSEAEDHIIVQFSDQ